MENISSFFATTPMFVFLIPVIIILIALLVVLNKSPKVEVVNQIPVPPVTTTPAPAQPTEVIAQVAISPQQTVPQMTNVAAQQSSVAAPAVTPVVAQVVTETPLVVAATVPVVASFRPVEQLPITEDVPFVPVVTNEQNTTATAQPVTTATA